MRRSAPEAHLVVAALRPARCYALRGFCLEAFGSIWASGIRASRCAAGSSDLLGTRSLRSLISRRQALLRRPDGLRSYLRPCAALRAFQAKNAMEGRALEGPQPDLPA